MKTSIKIASPKLNGRYRCVHYADGGACNFDMCGACWGAGAGQVRRSGRERQPAPVARGEEWQLSPTSKRSKVVRPTTRCAGMALTLTRAWQVGEESPGRVGRRSRDGGRWGGESTPASPDRPASSRSVVHAGPGIRYSLI